MEDVYLYKVLFVGSPSDFYVAAKDDQIEEVVKIARIKAREMVKNPGLAPLPIRSIQREVKIDSLEAVTQMAGNQTIKTGPYR